MTESAKCLVCKKALADANEHAMNTCTTCATTLGVVPMPPSTRPARPCTRCNGMSFLRVIPREYSSARSGNANAQVAGPMYLTQGAPTVAFQGLLSGTSYAAGQPQVERPGFGMLEVFACRGCGYLEWYCPTVNEVPASPVLMTEIIDFGPKAPHR